MMEMQSTLFEDSSNNTYKIEIETPEISESFMQSKLKIEMTLNTVKTKAWQKTKGRWHLRDSEKHNSS